MSGGRVKISLEVQLQHLGFLTRVPGSGVLVVHGQQPALGREGSALSLADFWVVTTVLKIT